MAIQNSNGDRNHWAEANIVYGVLGMIPAALVAGWVGALISLGLGIYFACKNLERAEKAIELQKMVEAGAFAPQPQKPTYPNAELLSDEEKFNVFIDLFKESEVILGCDSDFDMYQYSKHYAQYRIWFNNGDGTIGAFSYIYPDVCLNLTLSLNKSYETWFNCLREKEYKTYAVVTTKNILNWLVICNGKCYSFGVMPDFFNEDKLAMAINQKYGTNYTKNYKENEKYGYRRCLV